MARVDDYVAAKKIAVQKLAERPLTEILQTAGFEKSDENGFEIPFFDRVYEVSFPEFDFKDLSDEDKEVPLQEQVLILHYLISEDKHTSAGKWIAYREIPGAAFYFSAFVKRAIDPLKKVFGQNKSGLIKASHQVDGKAVEPGDAAFEFKLFPRVSLQVILWEGDDEFPPEANILFDETIGDIFSPEDVAWLAGMLVYRLISLSYQ